MGIKHRDLKDHTLINLEQLVPEDNFYRKLDTKLDLSFVRDLVQHLYVPYGRASIDPVVFFKLQLIMFFEAIRSERLLMKTVPMRLDHRWYLGYDLDEVLPDHSSLSKIRDRYGISVFHQFFETIVERCIEAGLVWGEELFFDGSMIYANASGEQVPRYYWEAMQTHLDELFESDAETEPASENNAISASVPDLIHRYSDARHIGKNSSYQRKADSWVSPVDPDATSVGHQKLGYRLQYVVDGGRSRIILNCLVTPAAIQDQTPMIDLAWRTRFRYGLGLKRIIADKRFGSGENLARIEDQHIQALMPVFGDSPTNRSNKKRLPKSDFTYDADRDLYVCPQGKLLQFRQIYQTSRLYRATPQDCKACPIQPQCTPSRRQGRSISHSIYQPYRDKVTAYQSTPLYQKAMRKRQVWIEPKFGELKQWHLGRRFRLRQLLKANSEALLKAAGQNIKQLLKGKKRSFQPLPPPISAALKVVHGFTHFFTSIVFDLHLLETLQNIFFKKLDLYHPLLATFSVCYSFVLFVTGYS